MEVRVGCFTLVVLLMSCGCKCSVSLPYDAVDWSSDCGITGHTHLIFDPTMSWGLGTFEFRNAIENT